MNPNQTLPPALETALSLLATATTAINTAGVILESLVAQSPGAAPPAAEGGAPICRHENKTSTATMSHPSRWMCRACGFEGEG